MKKTKGLYGLFDDCDGYHNQYKQKEMEPIHKFNTKKNEEVIVSKPKDETVKSQSVESSFCDHGNPISLSFFHQVFESNYEEDQHYTNQQSFENEYADDLDYYVESYEKMPEEDSKEEYHGKQKEKSDYDWNKKILEDENDYGHEKKQPKLPDNINEPNPKPPSVFPEPPQKMPIMPGVEDKDLIPLDDNSAFEQDIKAILKGKKDYEDFQEKVDPETVKQKKKQNISKAKNYDDPYDRSEHGIFEKIAQNMALANSYDLGSISLENKFDAFDKDMEEGISEKKKILEHPKEAAYFEKEIESQKKEESVLNKTTKSVVPVGTEEFLKDMDKMTFSNSYAGAFSNDIPLSPASGGRSIPIDTLEVGDIILSTTDDPSISGAIRKVTKSEVSHAGVYIGNGYIVEAIDSGIIERKLEEAMVDDTVTVAFRHQNITPEKGGAIRNFLVKKRKEKTKFDNHAVIKNLPIQIITSVCSNLSPALRDKCRNFAGRIFLGTETNNEFYCSELVFAAFEAAGLKLANTSPHWTSPEDLVQLSHNGTLRYVGHLKTTKF